MVRRTYRGRGLLNRLLNSKRIPELHIPGGYQYCGPFTNLKKRLERGDKGLNPLDRACLSHDLAYNQYTDLGKRHEADKVLAEKAWERVKASDSSLGEKAAALLVSGAMRVKRKLGAGLKRLGKRTSFKQLVKHAKVKDISSILGASQIAYRKARDYLRGKDKPRPPRVLPLPSKVGGFLPFLVPLMAGLGALGSLAGGAAAVARSVTRAQEGRKRLEEQKRHNLAMEAQKVGSGLYLKPYRKGYGLFVDSKRRERRSVRRRKI